MSGFIVIRNGEDGINIELKVTYNSSNATPDLLRKAIVAVNPQAFVEVEKRFPEGG